jgi:hypothetical protein
MQAETHGAAWKTVTAYFALSLALVLPVLLGSTMIFGDAVVHMRWQTFIAPEVWDGTLYPRWLSGMNEGFGSPAFFFYPPMLQWLAALFWPVAPDAVDVMQRLSLAVWLASAIGAVGCRFWLRAAGLPAFAANFGGYLFLLMPYRAFVDFYQRGALPELVGMSAIPWLLFFALRLQKGARGALAGYALSTAAILYSHLPAALMGLLLSSAYLVVLAFGQGAQVTQINWRLVWQGIGATVIGIALAAPCVVPALSLLGYLTDTDAMFGARNQPVNWLLFSQAPWVDPAMHLVTLALTTAALAASGILGTIAWHCSGVSRKLLLFLLGTVIVVALLNHAISRPFWALQTPLSRIQFPFRLLSLQVVALSGLGALALDAARPRWPKLARLVTLAVPGLMLIDAGLIGLHAYRDRQETNLPSVRDIIASTMDTSEYVLGHARKAAATAQDGIIAGSGVTERVQIAHRFTNYRVNAATSVVVALHQFAFTGWECRIDDGPWRIGGQMPMPLGLATCDVPPGAHTLEARLRATPWETGAWFAAGLAILVLLANATLSTRRPVDYAPSTT